MTYKEINADTTTPVLPGEVWKAVHLEEFKDDYQVSNLGRVRSLWRGKVRILKGGTTPYGYRMVSFYKKGLKRKGFTVHSLVLPPKEGFIVDHINSVVKDNRLVNLQHLTHRQNTSKERTAKSGLPVGVCWAKTASKYKASIWLNNKRYHLGYFKTPSPADVKYQEALSRIQTGDFLEWFKQDKINRKQTKQTKLF
jgi:hypothetical protein